MFTYLLLLWLHLYMVSSIMFLNREEVSMAKGYYKVAELIWQRFAHLDTIPDYLPFGPTIRCNVSYKKEVYPGKWLMEREIERKPVVKWETEPNEVYCLYMMGVHVTSSTPFTTTFEAQGKGHIILEEFTHWIVGNIPGCNVREGTTVWEYQKAESPPEDEVLVYAIYVFEQNKQMKFNPVYYQSENKTRYETAEKFAQKYCLSGPICGNFFVLF